MAWFDQIERTLTLNPQKRMRTRQLNSRKREFVGSSLVYTTTRDRTMNKAIGVSDEEEFVKGQSSRDLRAGLDASELEIQLIDAIDNVGEFLRFIAISARLIVIDDR